LAQIFTAIRFDAVFMNKLQEAIGELRKSAERLMFTLMLAEVPPQKIFEIIPIDNPDSRRYKTVYGSSRNWHADKTFNLPQDIGIPLKASFEVLRSCIRNIEPRKSDMQLLAGYLNDSSAELKIERNCDVYYISKGSSYIRTIVEDMARYLYCLAQKPELREHAPIGICTRCDGIFMKRRTDQEYCSDVCRSESWAAKQGKEYFAEKARQSRAYRKAQRKRQQGGVGKIEGELSPKGTKTHRKPRRT
jgi:hypothetical protein